MTHAPVVHLVDLRAHRSAPALTQGQRQALEQELRQRVAACEWCTIGVMAPDRPAAWAALRSFERAFGWPPLLSPLEGEGQDDGPVFLKGHQGTGQVSVREEAGLGEGVLVSGHSAAHPDAQDTWGPFPLDFFGSVRPEGPGHGAVGL